MPGWSSLWLYPFAIVVALVLFALNTPVGLALGAAWAFVVFPGAALLVRRRSTGTTPGEDRGDVYWRTGTWQSGR